MNENKPNGLNIKKEISPPLETSLKQMELSYDSIKQLTTLSTGSIFLIIGFLEKLFPTPEWKFLVGIALLAFSLTILLNLMLSRVVAFNLAKLVHGDIENLNQRSLLKLVFATVFAPILFYVGIISVIIFAFKNLF